MNLHYLINSTVRLTAQLVAQLATTGGARAPLVHVEGELFLELSKELERLGVSRKVGADMFGLIRRSYLKKIQRLAQSQTEVGRTLWEAIFEYVHQRESVSREAILERFRFDDPGAVTGILHDMCETGLLINTKQEKDAHYRTMGQSELGRAHQFASAEALEELLWSVIFGSGPITKEELLHWGTGARIEEALESLVAAGRVVVQEKEKELFYRSEEQVVPEGEGAGWEAGVFDHLRAVVNTLRQSLAGERPEGLPRGSLGGSTYTLDVWPNHPHAEEAYGLLREFRDRVSELREKIDAHNKENGRVDSFHALVFYAGMGATTQAEAPSTSGDKE